MLFSGDEVKKPLRSLSGGEAARLIFARIAVERPNVLLLDEPTNHLDLEAIEALVEGLQAYDGTLVFVSHDRWFVSQLAERIVEITPAGIQDFRGTYEEYLERCGDDHLDAESVLLRVRRDRRKEKARAAATPEEERERQKQVRRLNARRDQVTAAVERHETRVHEINEIFCDPTYFERTPRDKVGKLEAEQKKLNAEIEALMAEWATIEEELESLQGVGAAAG